MGIDNARAKREELKATGRNKALWDHYNTNGSLLLADFKRLTGGQFRQVMDTFDKHGLTPPPVYDSRGEKYKRRAKRLRDEAERLGQDHLTIKQAAKVLGVKPGKVVGIEGRLLRAGCSLPDIITEDAKIRAISYKESREYTEFSGRLCGTCNPFCYPTGLQVAKYWPGPGENQITYLLR